MSTLTARLPFAAVPASRPANPFDISPRQRTLIALVGGAMTLAVLVALVRGLGGIAPDHAAMDHLAIVIHVATVVPAIPLGAYLLLSRKGTKAHKLLGRVWVALMVATALSAIFIKVGGNYSVIHIFVPLTLIASWKLVATARRGDMKGHRKEILSLYLGALTIPGIASMAIPGRLMNVWLLG
ncbi:MAG: DUF2306 domain-containing protein [Erythrobacter sp.]|uniref:DUF2306 domain-containing protein n=1 Tax=Erythrobacter sp. TaxID=1042 RepID=UPI003C72B474